MCHGMPLKKSQKQWPASFFAGIQNHEKLGGGKMHAQKLHLELHHLPSGKLT